MLIHARILSILSYSSRALQMISLPHAVGACHYRQRTRTLRLSLYTKKFDCTIEHQCKECARKRKWRCVVENGWEGTADERRMALRVMSMTEERFQNENISPSLSPCLCEAVVSHISKPAATISDRQTGRTTTPLLYTLRPCMHVCRETAWSAGHESNVFALVSRHQQEMPVWRSLKAMSTRPRTGARAVYPGEWRLSSTWHSVTRAC